jgi:hypothetical protein
MLVGFYILLVHRFLTDNGHLSPRTPKPAPVRPKSHSNTQQIDRSRATEVEKLWVEELGVMARHSTTPTTTY